MQHEAGGPRRAGNLRTRIGDQRRLLVAAVDVVTEVDGLIAGDPSREIDPGDWDLVREPNVEALAGIASSGQLEGIRNLRVEMPATPISSSAIQRMIATGGEWESMVAPDVAAYIVARGLYCTSPAPGQ